MKKYKVISGIYEGHIFNGQIQTTPKDGLIVNDLDTIGRSYHLMSVIGVEDILIVKNIKFEIIANTLIKGLDIGCKFKIDSIKDDTCILIYLTKTGKFDRSKFGKTVHISIYDFQNMLERKVLRLIE